ncbi:MULTISPECIES: acyl-CoA dehydrogenase family protein [Bradyrhizobium]|jgi:acyl-CoA dehydrogenase|uniref:acyl-CoA dehydrogenase family protein n=1 Tax=Bradyrhizobium TaxID=374 RepID=UPI00039D9A31|nr:acyl-CoA dehydrogenase family protein [Bradyrhizobium denitrificans]MCL8482866.1 acyl-CoA/acyl-ACP dehydrogenase [Bradyrhizobium denitrificans]
MVGLALAHTELSGFDAGFSAEELSAQGGVNRFAAEVMRPIGRELDRMTPDTAYQKGSPFWDFHRAFASLGIGSDAIGALDARAAARMEAIVISELGWGDAGLAVSAGAGEMPMRAALASGERELVEMCTGKLGCWAATQPDRGSDGLMLYADERHPGAKGNVGNLRAKFAGDEIVINGQSSAWVSNGCIAEVALLDIAADYGDGFHDEVGNVHGCNIVVPLDLPGIARGKPLAKIGKRALPQGEIYFDGVRVPRRWAVATRDDYPIKHAMAWAHAGTAMSHIAAGLARAAFELALSYTNQRRQGGALLADLQLTQFRLGTIGAKVEAIKAMARHVADYTSTSPQPHPYFTAAGKAFCNAEMLTVVNEALQLFGGLGLTQEYPIEKLLRDARAMQIEDGENNLLLMHFGFLMTRLNREGWGRK